ncbi:hypothetical protein [Microbispora sp. NPDC049125]|uniref:hypothetical protein n=1 Tax=Microbispora sp. NPDC049125 TaxID=3154929 RepID=UPI00346647F6
MPALNRIALAARKVAEQALATYNGGTRPTPPAELTGRWMVHSGVFGSTDSDPTYLFEARPCTEPSYLFEDGYLFWIDEKGVLVADDLPGYFADAE